MRYWLIFILCLICSSCLIPPPDMSLQNSRPEVKCIPESWLEEPVILLKDSVVLSVKKENTKNVIYSTDISYVYINKRNPTIFEKLVFYEFTGLEITPKIQATVLYPDGSTWKTGVSDFKKYPSLHDGLWASDDFIHTFSFPRYIEGMIIKLIIKRKYTAPEHFGHEYIRGRYPILQKHICFSYPSDYALNYFLGNTENLQVDTLHILNSKTPVRSFIINTEMLKKKEESNRLKSPENWYAGLHYSVPPIGAKSFTWKELGDHYLKKIAPAMISSQKIKDLAASISTTQKDSIIAEAFRLLQHNIRYHANFENSHSFIPRPAPEIMNKGYGDCKEMSTLLKILLQEKDIEVNLALITTEGVMQCQESVPTLSNFNHLIAYHQDSQEKPQFYDPTVTHGTAANSYFHIIGQKALLLKEGASALERVDKGLHFVNVIKTKSKISRSAKSGKWQIEGVISLKGKAAYTCFPYLDNIRGEEIPPFVSGFLKETFNLNTTTTSIKSISSDRIEFKYTAGYQGNWLEMDKGGFLLNSPSLFGGDVRYTTLEYEGPRFFTGFDQHDVWELPAGFTDLEKSDLDHWIGKGVWKTKSNLIKRSYSVEEADVPEEKREEIKEFYSKKRKFLKTTVWR